MTSYVATLIAPATGFTAFAENIKKIITGNNGSISQEKILHNETSKSNLFPNRTIHEISFSLPSASDAVSGLKKAVFAEAVKHSSPGLGYNVAIQLDSVYRRHKRLVVFDMDSTLIEQEVIDEIARCCGVVDQVANHWRDVGLLKGTPVSVLETVRAKITFTPGVRDLCKVLKRLGFQLAVISGGFLPLAKYVKAELNLDFAYANQLQVSQDGTVLEGKTFGPIVDGTRKAELLDVIAQSCNVGVNQVVAVGDGANDLPMLGLAGLGVAFNAKPRVQEQAEVCINQSSLLFVLALLGLTSDEIAEALKA